MKTSMAGSEPGTSRRKGKVYPFNPAKASRLCESGAAEPADDEARAAIEAFRSNGAKPTNASELSTREDADALTSDDARETKPTKAPRAARK